ncbi:Cytochrome p450 [Thalictrum thalictroides]|uniref:Cytochrome p450 n=1 Tax=Thalictrum thalictroides TaxID=46969 RepID=A0A7J6UZ64_THATH|nr:Cytochrome p450 [Thalictrum thalictroides]
MFMLDQCTHRGLAALGKQYGGLVHLQSGVLHMVAVTTPDIAREVLQVNDANFANRPANLNIKYLTYDHADMAFANYGPFWRQMRKLCVMKVFSKKRAESWTSVRDEVETTVQTVKAKSGSAVNIGELVFSLTRNITYRSAFGSGSNEGQDEFISILQEFSKLFGAFNICDFFPFLTRFDPHGFNKRCAEARNSLDGFIDNIIDEHIAKKKNMNSIIDAEADTDMVDDLLAFYNESGIGGRTVDSQSNISFTRDNIKALIMDVMFGGTETVASAIEWAMAELLKSPEDLKKAQQELNEVVGLDRRVNEADLNKLSFLKCIVKETLRLHPPIPLLLHETIEYCEVGGYAIPPRSRVLINAWAIGRDKTAWDEPDTFKPSRFEKENAADFKGLNFEFIPFGSGRRSCPGMQLGLYSLELAVAHLVHCFSWELPDGMKPSELDMSDVFGLTAPRAIRLVAVPTPRLQCCL